MNKVTYSPAGDQGIVMNFSSTISEETNHTIRSMIQKLREKNIKGVKEVIPSFTSLLVLYDYRQIKYEKLKKKLMELENTAGNDVSGQSAIFEIPVCYEGEFAPDLSFVAQHAQISEEEVIQRHSGREYLIYMLGFLPGFVYLGGMDETIFTPRLSSPRTTIPAGSVGIGGQQTGIYPLSSPGGWQLIGRTPVKIYDPNRQPSILYEMGDYIRFVPISAKEYSDIEAQVQNGNYTLKKLGKKIK